MALLPATVHAQFTTLTVSSGSALPGSTVQIGINLGPNGSSGTAANFTLSFDPPVATIDSTASIARGTLIANTDHALRINLTAGTLMLVIASDTLRSFSASSGTLVNIQFRIPAGATPGASTELRLSDTSVVTTGGSAMSVITENGAIQVQGTGTTTTSIASTSTSSTLPATSTTRATSTTMTSTTSTTRPPGVSTTTTRISTSTTTSTTRASTTTSTSTTSSSTTTTLRSTPEEPATVQGLSIDPSQGCPGFYIGDVSLAPGAAEGMWGIEILLTAGERLLQGGLNLGGGFQENGGINGWGAFSISNSGNEPQEVNVQVDAQPLETPGYLASAFGMSIRLVQRVGQNDIPAGESVTGPPPLSFQRVVGSGFYILEARSLPGSPRGTFQMSATTKFTDRPGGGFQGGVVVGGYLARNAAGESLHGYGAFCISQAQAVSFQTFGRPNYAGVGAGNLMLTLKDRNQQVIWQSPVPTTTTTVTTTSTTRIASTTTASTTSTIWTIIIPTTTRASTTTSTSTTQRTSTTTSSTTSTTTTFPGIQTGNLLVNPEAEAGQGSSSGYDVVSIPGWTRTSSFTVVRYGAPDFPSTAESQRIAGGLNFFSGGPSNAESSAWQDVDLTSWAAPIDAGGVRLELRAWLASYSAGDEGRVSAEFRSGGGAVLGSLTIGPAFGGLNTFQLRQASQAVPIGARRIRVTLRATRNDGSYNDGYFDNLYLALSGSAVTTTLASSTSTIGISTTTSRPSTTISSTTSTTLIRTNIAGTLTRNETWTEAMSPIRLTDDVTVPAGITLTIQPGVDVLFAKIPSGSGGFDPDHTELLVSGTLIADAGPRNTNTEIRFISDAANPKAGDWGRIAIQFNGVGTFRNVRITHAMRCINARDNARVTVLGSRLEACGDFPGDAGGAIVRREDSSLEVRDSLFLNNQAALYFMGNRSDTASTAHNNSIYFNNYGIYLKGSSNPTLTGNDIFDNDHGLFAFEQARTSVFNNIFESNYIYGLRIRGEAVLTDFRHNNIDNPEARSSGGFDLDYANSLAELQAVDNYWGPFTEAQIETHIRHRVDDPALGLVRFVPFAASPFPVPESFSYGTTGQGARFLIPAAGLAEWFYHFAGLDERLQYVSRLRAQEASCFLRDRGPTIRVRGMR